MVFGLVPLMMAHGVGANGSRSLATGVIGGMIVGTLALLFLVPSLFIVFQWLQERTMRKRDKTEPQEWRWSMNEDFE